MFSLIFAKYKWAFFIGAVLVVVGMCSYTVNKVLKDREQRGYNKAVGEYTVKQLAAEQAARAKETQLKNDIQKAQNDAIIRDNKINDLSKRLATTSSGLRDTIADYRRKLSADPATPANKQADTVLHVLGACQSEYGEMAEAADRHASDVKMLQDAWPK